MQQITEHTTLTWISLPSFCGSFWAIICTYNGNQNDGGHVHMLPSFWQGTSVKACNSVCLPKLQSALSSDLTSTIGITDFPFFQSQHGFLHHKSKMEDMWRWPTQIEFDCTAQGRLSWGSNRDGYVCMTKADLLTSLSSIFCRKDVLLLYRFLLDWPTGMAMATHRIARHFKL